MIYYLGGPVVEETVDSEGPVANSYGGRGGLAHEEEILAVHRQADRRPHPHNDLRETAATVIIKRSPQL
jgi:hypothetical protein